MAIDQDQTLLVAMGLIVCSICAVGIISALQIVRKALKDGEK